MKMVVHWSRKESKGQVDFCQKIMEPRKTKPKRSHEGVQNLNKRLWKLSGEAWRGR